MRNNDTLEKKASCELMSILLSKVRDGNSDSSPLLGKYCGTLLPNPVFSQSRQLYLRFKSNGAVSSRGYEIIWTSSPTGKTSALCDGKHCRWEKQKGPRQFSCLLVDYFLLKTSFDKENYFLEILRLLFPLHIGSCKKHI